jgi:hypothetical protein
MRRKRALVDIQSLLKRQYYRGNIKVIILPLLGDVLTKQYIIMSTAIHDFFTSELKLYPSNFDITVVSDNTKSLPSFEHNKGRHSLKCSNSRLAPAFGSNKKDYRWGETPSIDCQWDCDPTANARHRRPTVSRPDLADSATDPDTSSDEEVPLSPPVSVCSFSLHSSTELTFEVRADQAILKGTLYRPCISIASHTATRNSKMPVRALSDEDWRSEKVSQYMCDKQKDNVLKLLMQLGHLAAMEIREKGGNEPPQKPQRRMSLISKAA